MFRRGKKEKGVKKKKGFVGVTEVIRLYDDLYFSSKVKNLSAYGRKIPRQKNKIGIDFLGSYDGDKVSFYYFVDSLPRELYIDFKDKLRKECRQGVRINFINNITRHSIQWDSPEMRSRLRILRQVGDEKSSQDINVYNLHENIDSLSRQSWIEESLRYLAIADKNRGRALLKSTLLVIISGERGEAFDTTVKIVEEYSKHIGVNLQRILYEIPDLLKHYSPFSRTFVKEIDRISPKQVLTDEILARYNTYSQGTIGVGGIYFGTDVYSHFPVLKVVKPKMDTAENWLITAETGGGKSFLVKFLIIELLALGYNGTIMDVEGFEYLPLASYISHHSKVHILNMAEGTGRYFDPVEIADETGIEDIDSNAKNMSLNFTISYFKILVGSLVAQDMWVDTAINDAVSETYAKAGVTDDRSTWKNSKGLTLFDVYETLLTLRDYRQDPNYSSAVEKVIAITSRYFTPTGSRAYVFRERIVVSDILNTDLLVCSFGMAGKSPQAVDEIQLALMQLGAAMMSHMRSIFSKAVGKYNFKLWEEFQRWGKFPDSDKTLGVAITGGRKLGDVNIIITNVVKELLYDDRFGIFGNVTSYLIGAINDADVRRDLCARLSIPNMLPELDKIAAASPVNDDTDDEEKANSEMPLDPLAYAFLCGLDRNKYGTVRIMLPEALRTSNIFKTGVEVDLG